MNGVPAMEGAVPACTGNDVPAESGGIPAESVGVERGRNSGTLASLGVLTPGLPFLRPRKMEDGVLALAGWSMAGVEGLTTRSCVGLLATITAAGIGVTNLTAAVFFKGVLVINGAADCRMRFRLGAVDMKISDLGFFIVTGVDEIGVADIKISDLDFFIIAGVDKIRSISDGRRENTEVEWRLPG